jgi:methionyl aminopeptidase
MSRVYLKKAAEIERIRAAGKVVGRVLQKMQERCQPGVTTAELDVVAWEIISRAGGQASFFNYRVDKRVFPAHICVSVNDEVVHGIPGPRRLKDGDIVGVDVGVFLHGFHADSAATFPVGRVSEVARRLLEATRGALNAGIAAAVPGRRVGNISAAVQRHAESRGYGVVRELVGHGVGRRLHEDPQIPNWGSPGDGEKLRVGMTLAIEPMINAGTHEIVALDDGWSVVTADRSLSAHFEHTVSITPDGADILTLP